MEPLYEFAIDLFEKVIAATISPVLVKSIHNYIKKNNFLKFHIFVI